MAKTKEQLDRIENKLDALNKMVKLIYNSPQFYHLHHPVYTGPTIGDLRLDKNKMK